MLQFNPTGGWVPYSSLTPPLSSRIGEGIEEKNKIRSQGWEKKKKKHLLKLFTKLEKKKRIIIMTNTYIHKNIYIYECI